MNVTPQRLRPLAMVAIILMLTALVGWSASHFKTSAANGAANFKAATAALSYAPLFPPPLPVITNSGTANDIIYNLPGGDGDNLAILEDDGVPGNGMSQLRSGNSSFVTVVFANPANTLAINASNDGEKITVNNVDSGFVAKINLKGGTAPDVFALGDGATLKNGTVNGAGGPDTLDYTAYTTAVSVNLGINTGFYGADITPIQETPPNTSTAFGSGSNAYDTPSHSIFGLGLLVSGITPAQVTGLKLRRGAVNTAGPVVANLIGLGSIAPSGNGFQYNAPVVVLPTGQEAAFLGGLLYVEVETTAFPAGELRGQIMPNGPFNPTQSTATGISVGGVQGITTVIGGSGNDSLVGSVGEDVLRGGPGDDTLYGGPSFSSDRMQGEGGNDTILVNALDITSGPPIIDGGPGSDLVNVNGRQNVDPFFAEPAAFSPSGPGRLTLHTSNTTNDVDIGTVETLTVSGYAGNDTFLVGSLVGVNDLTTINLNGMVGNDTFNITPSATVTFTVNGGDPTTPTFPGDLLNLNTTGTTNLVLAATNGATGTQGAYTFANRQTVNFLTLEAVNPTTIKVSDVTVPEGNAGSTGAVFAVTLDAPTNTTVTVDYVTFNTTAVSPGDYTNVNGTVTFAAGQTTRFVTVPVNGDTLAEGNETFILNLSNPVGALLVDSQGIGTIVDDDPATPPPSISINNVAIAEGNSGSSNAVFTATLSAASPFTVSVDVFTSNGTATAPVDYQSAATTLTFLPGVTTASFIVPVNGDTTPEANETFFVNLTGAINATILVAKGTGTITDDDPVPPTPSISINNVSITEGNNGSSSAVFTATLSAASDSTISVDAFTSNGTATAPVDYQSAATTLIFLPGSTTANFIVPVNGDTTPEGNETFFVNLTGAINATISVAQGTGTINDDDATSIFQFSGPTATVAENAVSGSATITINRTGDTSGVASVKFETSDLSAKQQGDYTFGSGVVQFAPGEASKTFNVLLVNDALIEGAETFAVTLSNPSGNCAVGSPGQIVVTITDDDVTTGPNPIDDSTFFVRQHYLDFLGREADPSGLAFWVGSITSCGADANCREVKRINASAGFFLSIEFQETSGFVIRTQRVAFGRLSADPASRVPYLQFMRDTRQVGEAVVVGQTGYEAKLEANKQLYAQQLVTSAGFIARFPITAAAPYVDGLYASAGVVPTEAERTAAINAFGAGGTAGRVAALRAVADAASVRLAERNPSFVLAEYYGYLRRNPTDAPDFGDEGFQFWLSKLNSFGGDFIKAEMVKAFISSKEYRARFGQP